MEETGQGIEIAEDFDGSMPTLLGREADVIPKGQHVRR
jgi:hypothetical protein